MEETTKGIIEFIGDPLQTTKSQILFYLEEQYKKTHWPFHKKVTISNMFGKETDQALKELHKEGIVLPREGAQGRLVQYVTDEKQREKVKNHYLKTNKV